MSPVLNLGGEQIQTLSDVLSKHLSRTRKGRRIIRSFARDSRAGSQAILEYIDRELKDQPELHDRIREALGGEAGEHFTTVIGEGGHVDQVINAGSVQQLSIHYSFFQDSLQVATFLAGLVLIGAAIALGLWWTIQPKRMTGDFNIFVAELSQTGEQRPQVAEVISHNIFGYLDSQAKGITFEDVQVAHSNFPKIRNAVQARELAQKINAQVVIYGDVANDGDEALLTPQFYIAEEYRSNVGELNGQQKLAAPLSLPVDNLVSTSPEALRQFQDRTVILTEFTKTLVFLALGDLPLAKQAVNTAIDACPREGTFEGQEILYLFASEIARRQKDFTSARQDVEKALQLNPQYGRAYIAQANIYYDEGNLYQAMEVYRKADALDDQPYGAYVKEKANMGMGNSCLAQFQFVKRNAQQDPAGVSALEQCSRESYGYVIDFYNQQKKPEKSLQEMTAWAYYNLGILDQELSQFRQAREMYEQALELTTYDELIRRARRRLQEVQS